MNNYSIPLFPLNLVVCPGGLLPLRIFETRYLDMVKKCLKNKSFFAIVAVLPEDDNDPESKFSLASVGTLVEIIDADVTTVGLMIIRCVGLKRIKVDSILQQADGLVIGTVNDIDNDVALPIPDDLKIASSSLQRLLELPDTSFMPSEIPVIKPYQFDDASWVANRWVELLDLALLEKQRLMQLDSPILRLEMIIDIMDFNTRKLG